MGRITFDDNGFGFPPTTFGAECVPWQTSFQRGLPTSETLAGNFRNAVELTVYIA
jgi:hypothetical protein